MVTNYVTHDFGCHGPCDVRDRVKQCRKPRIAVTMDTGGGEGWSLEEAEVSAQAEVPPFGHIRQPIGKLTQVGWSPGSGRAVFTRLTPLPAVRVQDFINAQGVGTYTRIDS
ncbi:hypothetical protein DPX16_14863 [Anabarilius grahami]|uniref:Uncharacterized protein n=1 Tax=Anabarilius grahami TaxID=495550 RepID=A0A3N0YWK8_ANAGA|nr:hypothetical protein DPX16_14863 [Anabarilius grahami]